jgi:hypothetical protein
MGTDHWRTLLVSFALMDLTGHDVNEADTRSVGVGPHSGTTRGLRSRWRSAPWSRPTGWATRPAVASIPTKTALIGLMPNAGQNAAGPVA